jgi:mannose/fructose/N-acetylgalactosamine-specific phosphotransferase system component IIB
MRADDRLIHGIVAVEWTKVYKPEVMVVANDNAATDAFTGNALRLAKPAGVALYIWTLADAVQKLDHPKIADKKIFVVTKTIEDAAYLCEHYGKIPVFNISTGAITRTPDMKTIVPEIFMSDAEFGLAQKMRDSGVEVFAQYNTSSPKVSFENIAKIFG